MKVYTLLDNRTRVPKDPEVYKNKIKFDISLLTIIDTGVIYEEYSTEKKMLERLDIFDNTKRRYLAYKFYPNGYFNVFAFDKNNLPSVKEFDPNYAGMRGIYYQENNRIQYEEFSAIDQVGHIGRIKGTFKISGDTLYEQMNDRKGIDAQSYPIKIYIKRNLPPQYFVYKADW
jgi:hypothetical protein